jgi:hypothetical protein
MDKQKKAERRDELTRKFVGKMRAALDVHSKEDALIVASVTNGGNLSVVVEGMAGTLEKLMAVAAVMLEDQMHKEEADKDRGISEFCDVVRDIYLMIAKQQAEKVQEHAG